MDDSRIIELYFQRDQNAIRETQSKYEKLCFHISKNIVGNEADAEECVNDTYLAVWNAIPPERPGSLKAFVAGIARKLSLKRWEYNSAQKRSAPLVEFSELEGVLADEEIPGTTQEAELGQLISDFLRTEKEEARNVFLRKYWYFDSITAIARRYSFSESKVKSMLFQTRTRLRAYLISKEVHI